MPYQYAILYHNYYSLEGVEDMRRRIAALGGKNILLLCSLSEKLAAVAPSQREDEKFVVVSNIGKDIGGKLILIQLLLTLYPEVPYVILLHDKRSYQKHSGSFEKEGLFSIVGRAKFDRIAAAFDADHSLGIVGAKGFLRNEHLGGEQFDTPNSPLLAKLIKDYGMAVTDWRFVAGTMFWIRTALLRDFFGSTALTVRSTLEEGNVLDHENGTYTHCWERLLSWIAPSAGFKLKEM